ncbi:MAG: hypothetical protein LBJ84_05255 [Oscillospiraceae bacterium]|jgi:hypothetical protein|nr:hypothetical protein [Oscillospiraceae bacterium]
MKKLTFKGFLLRYLMSLSGKNTRSIAIFAEMANDNPRLVEPLVLYTFASGADPSRLQASATARREYVELQTCADSGDALVRVLADSEAPLPVSYRKVYDTYKYYASRTENDRYTITLMHKKIVKLLEAQRLPPYRVCKELELNSGNFYAFYRHGDATKLSLATARRVLEYASRQQ